MGLLLIGVVAGFLIGYGFAPSQASFQECAWQGCLDRAATSQLMELKSTAPGPPATAGAKRASAANPGKSSTARSGGRTDLVKTANAPARTDAAASDRPAESSDPVLNKAKIAVAAKMEDPSSAEFGDMKRAIRKNVLGKPVDTICGHVKGKDASGSDTEERPFLYLVKEGDVYVVAGKADPAAAIAYRNICN
jgi:hypothetical protein